MCAAQIVPECLNSCGAVVVTGASSGIGAEFLKAIASINPKIKFFNLSRTDPQNSFAPGRLKHSPADLSDAAGQEAAVTATEKWLDGEGADGEIILINNSGFGSYGPFPEPGFDRTLQMLDLNVRAPVVLTGRLLPRLRQRGGAVINISSTAAFQPTPLMSVYGATKAFIMNWSLGLWSDLRGTNVHVLCVCPGPTTSNFFRAAGFDEAPVPDGFGQTSAQVVDESLRALAARKPLVVCGWKNKLLTAISSRLPRALVTTLTFKTMDKLRAKPLARQKAGTASQA